MVWRYDSLDERRRNMNLTKVIPSSKPPFRKHGEGGHVYIILWATWKPIHWISIGKNFVNLNYAAATIWQSVYSKARIHYCYGELSAMHGNTLPRIRMVQQQVRVRPASRSWGHFMKLVSADNLSSWTILVKSLVFIGWKYWPLTVSTVTVSRRQVSQRWQYFQETPRRPVELARALLYDVGKEL